MSHLDCILKLQVNSSVLLYVSLFKYMIFTLSLLTTPDTWYLFGVVVAVFLREPSQIAMLTIDTWQIVNQEFNTINFCPLFSSDSGFAAGIYTTNSPEACRYVADNCKANIIVVENHKQLQKILQVRPRINKNKTFERDTQHA